MAVIEKPGPEVGAISGNLVVEVVGYSTVWCRCICGKDNHRRVAHHRMSDDWRSGKICGCLACSSPIGTKAKTAGWRHDGSLRGGNGSG